MGDIGADISRDEASEVYEAESVSDTTVEKGRKFVTIPDAGYYFSVVGSEYLPNKPKTEENFRVEVSWHNTLVAPAQVKGWLGPIPKGFSQNVSELQDCSNPVHFRIQESTEVNYLCRWCKKSYSGRNNQYRHERKCDEPGAPGHVCPDHPDDCPNKDKPGHLCRCPPNCAGACEWTPNRENDKRKNNSRGNIARKRQQL
ncbi:uncharacterized protein LOC107371140 [Tetranychus urticae]|uniref:Uncharacterized protein n=1 Tax=Tetranychus urticae TaxID=32264 RepID=T1JWD8_TETUR|nr:uncharacterized protein LOC107371140 [Tetranychus urticae]